jgi:hypothetical protein
MPKTINGEQLDPQAYRLFKAIREKESGGNYNAVGDNATSTGAFQFQAATWKGYAKDVLGDENAPMTKGNQNQVAYKKIKAWKDAGWTPAQIAAAWNAGEQKALDGTWKTNVGYNQKIGVSYNTPQYVGDVLSKSKALKSLEEPIIEQAVSNAPQGYNVPTPLPVPQPQRDTLLPSLKAVPNQPVRNIFRTFANIPSSAERLTKNTIAPVNPFDIDSPLNIGANIVKGAGALKDIVQDRGVIQGAKDIFGGAVDTGKTGANIVSNLAKQGVQSVKDRGFGGAVAEGVSQVAEVGIEDPLMIPSIIYAPSKIRGTGVTTDTISATAKPVIDTTRKIAEPVQDLVAKKQSNLFVKAVDDLEQTYTDIFSGTTIGKKKVDKIKTKTDNLNRAGTVGVTPQRVLAEAGVIPKISGTKLDTFEQATDFRKTVEPLKEANRNALAEIDSLGVKYDVNVLKNQAIKEAKTPANINSGKFETMQRNILRDYNALQRQYPNGVTLQQIDDIKSARWDNVFQNKGLIDADVLKKNSDYAIAKSLQKHIEDVANKSGNTKVAQLNREIGSRLDAAKFLEELNGKTLKGGRLLKYVTTAIGSSLGQSAFGKVVGAFGGNMVGNIMISSQVSNPIKRAILRTLKQKNPQAYQETIEWLAKQSDARKNRLLLPAGDKEAIRLFDGVQREASGAVKENPIRLLPAQKGQIGIDPKTGRFMKTYTQESQSKSPTSQQTTPATTNVVNKANIPTQSNTLPKKSSGVINTITEKIKNTPNKQGGFIKLPQGKADDLVTEAKKYKSADDFVNKVENSTTGIGSVGKIADSFDYKTIDIKPVGDMNLAKFSLGADAKYFKRAEGFGDLAKIMKDKNNNIFVYLNDGVDPNKLNKKTLANFTNSYEPWNKSASKRFITNDNGKSWQEVSAFELGSATSGMTKSQLTDIWNKANKK